MKTHPGHPSALVPTAGSGRGPDARTEPVPDEVALAFHPRTLAQVLLLRSHLRGDDRTDRFLRARLAGILHGKTAVVPVDDHAQHVQHGPPLRVRLRRPDGLRAAGSATPSTPWRPSWTACIASRCPPPPGIALHGDARTAGRRARAALRAHGLPDRARLVVTSPPYLRVLKYGYYNWLRTWLLGFDAAAIDAELDAAHRREPYLVFLREVLADLRPALTDDGIAVVVIGDVEMDRGKPSDEGIGLAERAWEEAALPAGYRLAGVVRDEVAANRKMTRLWGDAGRPGDEDRPDPGARCRGGRAPARAGHRRPRRSTGSGRRRGCARSDASRRHRARRGVASGSPP